MGSNPTPAATNQAESRLVEPASPSWALAEARPRSSARRLQTDPCTLQPGRRMAPASRSSTDIARTPTSTSSTWPMAATASSDSSLASAPGLHVLLPRLATGASYSLTDCSDPRRPVCAGSQDPLAVGADVGADDLVSVAFQGAQAHAPLLPKEGAWTCVPEIARPNDLTAEIDGRRSALSDVETSHRPFLPKKGTLRLLPSMGVGYVRKVPIPRGSDDLAVIVDPVCLASLGVPSPECSQIGHQSLLPQKGVGFTRLSVAPSDDLAEPVDRGGSALQPPKVPRSVMVPFCQRTACSAPVFVVLHPAI